MEKLLEVFSNIDSKIFESAEVKTKLQEAFLTAVNEKAEQIAQGLFESKEAEYTKALDEMVQTVRESIELDQKEKFNEAVETKVKELTEEYSKSLKEEAEAKLNEEVTKLSEEVQKTLEIAIKEFVEDNKSTWQNEVEVTKANSLKEEFTKLAEKFGVEILSQDLDTETKKVNESLTKSIEREKNLQEKVNELLKEKILKESSKGLTSVQLDKLYSLIESVPFINEKDYTEKIDKYKAVIEIGSNSKVDESKGEGNYVPSWKRK